MLPDRVSNPGPLAYESGALPIALRGPADGENDIFFISTVCNTQRRKKDCDVPLRWKNRDLNVEFQRFDSGKHQNTANAMKTVIAQIFICKG